MIIDTSALVAIIMGEPGYERYKELVRNDVHPTMSAFSLYEAGTVLLRRRGAKAVLAILDAAIPV